MEPQTIIAGVSLFARICPFAAKHLARWRLGVDGEGLLFDAAKVGTVVLERHDVGVVLFAGSKVVDQTEGDAFQKRLAAFARLLTAGYLVPVRGQPTGALGEYSLTPAGAARAAKIGSTECRGQCRSHQAPSQ